MATLPTFSQEEHQSRSPRSLWGFAETALHTVNQSFPDANHRDANSAVALFRATEQLLSILKLIVNEKGQNDEVVGMMNNVSLSDMRSPVRSPLTIDNGTPRKRPRSSNPTPENAPMSTMPPLDMARISTSGPINGPKSADRGVQRLPSIHQILSERELRPMPHSRSDQMSVGNRQASWGVQNPGQTFPLSPQGMQQPQGFTGGLHSSTDGVSALTSPRSHYQGSVSPRGAGTNLSPRGNHSPAFQITFSGSGGNTQTLSTSPIPPAARKTSFQSKRAPSAPNMVEGVTFTDRPYGEGDEKKGMFGHFSVLNSGTGDQSADFPHEKEKRQRRKKNADMDLKCLECSTRETPEWRRGPKGPKTLCNACGLKYAKKLKQQQQQQQQLTKC
uniref:GATA-type domain-containing protein n=1 Tax=Paramoeba aestuarina TaxID=180227 RepID=A0A7S4U979_9EUKA|mmetsp:Transcript_36091/g.56490  ORF Transcript_36091/g.56490 Transcript_36091/m.56490 type:complete len:388 (+) Transcript_36091:290-1453(+)